MFEQSDKSLSCSCRNVSKFLIKLIKSETVRCFNKKSTHKVGGRLFCFCPSAIESSDKTHLTFAVCQSDIYFVINTGSNTNTCM